MILDDFLQLPPSRSFEEDPELSWISTFEVDIVARVLCMREERLTEHTE